MNVNPFSYLTNAINTVIQTNDNVVNLSSKTAKQLIDDVYAGGAKVWYISATGGQKLSDLPIVQAGTYVVYAFTYYKAIHFIGSNGRNYVFNYGDNAWKEIALTSDIPTQNKIASYVNLSSTSSSNKYTVPSDGYIYVDVTEGNTGYITILGSNEGNTLNVGGSKGYYATFVRSGMKAYKNGNVNSYFMPLS